MNEDFWKRIASLWRSRVDQGEKDRLDQLAKIDADKINMQQDYYSTNLFDDMEDD